MDSITLENFRCFRERQTARLAPLTLLVGENSTGKTSFMALIRALWDVAYEQRVPDFKADPYDLGSFDEIAHHRNANQPPAKYFEAGFRTKRSKSDNKVLSNYFEAKFEKKGTIPIPTRRYISHEKISVEEVNKNGDIYLLFQTKRGKWEINATKDSRINVSFGRKDTENQLFPFFFFSYYIDHALHMMKEHGEIIIHPVSNSPNYSEQDLSDIRKMLEAFSDFLPFEHQQPYPSAPVRSKPKRTYDPSRPIRDPEGDHIPMYLADLYSQNKKMWQKIHRQLEEFGCKSGLFDQISIKQLGQAGGGPFQIQIRKFSKRRKGPQRNLIDVGYGVSQVLPLVAELLRTDAPDIFLLQQPEVHLHPSAQAALGSLFCQVASNSKQLIIETHSDYILDRIRMDIRDQSSPLKPEDVSLLFFERGDLDVHIHSLKFDEQGNVLGTPPGYRRFFLEEVRRSIGI